MSTYQAPIRDMHFALTELADVAAIAALPGFEDTADVVDAILDEAGNFAAEVLDPLNAPGDRAGATWTDGNVKTAPGFKQAYKQFAQAGWVGLPFPADYGGQGLPQVLSAAATEMWNAANMAFALCPLLNQGAIEALLLCGTDEQKKTYVPKLVSGEWTGTMVLTEPQAGSDLAAVRTRAVPEGDHYKISGQKIYITYGEHDYTENIIHLVLARTPNAPAGVKGISLFVVPKFLVNTDGTLGARNDVQCAALEHKLGIHSSPTATLNYGEAGGATGYLIGEENRGLEYMFIMMNLARFSIGVQGIGVADRAYQHALAYAKERTQSKDLAVKDPTPVTIINHPDVRRLLMTSKAQIEAMRGLALVLAAAMDHAHANPDPAVRAERAAFVELMTPIVKGWSTENSLEITSNALQVFGGMGFVEETGAAQYYRDARITTIYEGTTAIQANALVGRSLLRDKTGTVAGTIAAMRATAGELATSADAHAKAIHPHFIDAIDALEAASQHLVATAPTSIKDAFAGSVPYLMLWGTVAGGWQMARSALAASKNSTDEFNAAKLVTARYYAEHILSRAFHLRAEIIDGGATVNALSEAAFELDRKRPAFA